MSDFAQKRDVSDPRTVQKFAEQVQDTNRLDLLTVLDRLRYSRGWSELLE